MTVEAARRQFEPAPPRVSFPDLEQEILEFWREQRVFERSIEERPADRLFSFYEGPPTANGTPGVHHVLARVFKDLIPRYKTMRGYRAPRKGGWDTHGLPVELEVERELGLRNKREIEEYGVAAFNEQCRQSVFRYVADWERMTDRVGCWIDMDDAYVTYSNEYIESCWWIFRRLWDRDLIFRGYRVTPHCPRCGTSLSSHEIALGYREDTPDPSVTVLFELKAGAAEGAPNAGADPALRLGDGAPTYVVAWTTTPWTLPGNTALAVSAEAEYALVEDGGRRLLLASDRVRATLPGDGTPESCSRASRARRSSGWSTSRSSSRASGRASRRWPSRAVRPRTSTPPTRPRAASSPPTSWRRTTARASCTSPRRSARRTMSWAARRA